MSPHNLNPSQLPCQEAPPCIPLIGGAPETSRRKRHDFRDIACNAGIQSAARDDPGAWNGTRLPVLWRVCRLGRLDAGDCRAGVDAAGHISPPAGTFVALRGDL